VTRKLARATLAAVGCLGGPAYAHPVTYPGNTMAMGEFTAKMQDANAWYTFAPNHAFGPGYMGFKADDRDIARRIPNLHYNYRVKRWNAPDSQANVYVQAGAGYASGTGFSGQRVTALPGVQLDYETQQIYVAFRGHVARSSVFHHNFSNVQLGYSPYKAEYEEIAPWAVLDLRYTSNLGNKVEVTPMLRLIRKTFFVEVGVSTEGRPRFTLMLNF
jgi:hypothetical protein